MLNKLLNFDKIATDGLHVMVCKAHIRLNDALPSKYTAAKRTRLENLQILSNYFGFISQLVVDRRLQPGVLYDLAPPLAAGNTCRFLHHSPTRAASWGVETYL